MSADATVTAIPSSSKRSKHSRVQTKIVLELAAQSKSCRSTRSGALTLMAKERGDVQFVHAGCITPSPTRRWTPRPTTSSHRDHQCLGQETSGSGHSTGGLLAQMLAGRGLSAVTGAIDPGVFRGVLPLPASVLRGGGPVPDQPAHARPRDHAHVRPVQVRLGQRAGREEAKELCDKFHVAGSGISLVQMGNANLNPWTEAKVDTRNPDRGPLLIIDGREGPHGAVGNRKRRYKRQRRNLAVTEIVKIPNRGHSLTIDHGWRDVAQTALDFVKRFVAAKPA